MNYHYEIVIAKMTYESKEVKMREDEFVICDDIRPEELFGYYIFSKRYFNKNYKDKEGIYKIKAYKAYEGGDEELLYNEDKIKEEYRKIRAETKQKTRQKN